MPESTVKVELTPELQSEFAKISTQMNVVKDAAKASVDAVKTQLDAQNADTGKKIDALEGKINLVVKNTPPPAADKTRGYPTLTEFFNDVIVAGMNLNRPDLVPARLQPLAFKPRNTVGSDEARQASNPDGGYLIPPAYLAELLTTDPQGIQANTGLLTRKVPMAADTVYVNARVDKDHSSSVSGGFRVYRREETASVTASKATYEQIKLQANSLMGLSYASEEILARSPVSFAALIQAGFTDEMISKLNYERLWGTGVGEYLGILNSAALITVAKVGGQTLKTINSTNLLAMRARAWRYGSCVWMANHDTLTQLMTAYIAISTAGGMPVYMPGNGIDKPETLLGRPIIFDENCATLGTEGDIVLVNWQEYLEGILGGATFMESVHVRFEYNERAFRFVVYNDGQPWWRSALTPKKSATTLSPYVSLAVRA